MTIQQITVAMIVAVAMFVNSLSHTTLGTALPSVAADFGIPPLRLGIAVTAELLSLAVFMPTSGWMSDRFGSRPVFLSALAIYALASAGCALSVNLEMLVVFRGLQGVGGAMMVPVARLVLLRVIPRDRLVEAMTWVTIPALLGVVMGPPLAGVLVTWAHWSAIFWIMLPVCAALGLLAWLRLPGFRREDAPGFDWRGFALSALGLAGLLLGLDRLAHAGRDPALPGLLLISGVVLLTLYARHARRIAAPIIDLRLLRVPAYRVAVTGGLVFRSAQACLPFLLPILFQTVFGWSPIVSGGLTFASALGAFAVKFAAPAILRRAGFRGILIWNGVLTALSIVACAVFDADTPHLAIMAVLFVSGWMRSLQYTALNVLTYADLSEQEVSLATGVSSMLQQVAEAIGVAAAALVMLLLAGAGGTPTQGDFALAFAFFGLWALAAQLIFSRLGPEDGAQAGLGRSG
ncbi:MFS transporter [Salipiger abyssi]|uniref:MFS transporter n=1 Tax=Salipiger abyssi TaxID=1250539 RepID=UPI0040588F5B